MKLFSKTAVLFLIFAVLLTGFSARGDYPDYVGYINDFAGLLDHKETARLNRLIGDLEKKTTAQIAVVTVDSIAPETVETYANKLFEKWGIGRKDKDNGVLLLVAVKERKTRIEVGYGLEGAIPDAKAYAVYRNILVPNFRAGDFKRGITRAVEVLAGMIAKEYEVEVPGLSPVEVSSSAGREKPGLPGILGGIVFVVLFILIFGLRMGLFGAILLGSGRRRGGYWYGGGGSSGGGFSGGFGGFGGGMSGGGGAGGGW